MFSRAAVVGAVIASAGAVGVIATAQTPQESSALLTEVRLMRQSIDSMVANNLRVQLLFGRIQSQQLPLGRAAAMLQAARSQLASFDVRYNDLQDRAIQLETMANDTGRSPDDTASLQREARTVRAEATRLEGQRSSLQMAEAEAARQHAEEQARMDALHAEIEELGRTLLAPTRR